MAKSSAQKRSPGPLGRIVNLGASVVGCVALAVVVVAAGFAVCAYVPATTRLLSEAFSGTANTSTPFSHSQLVDAAVATRAYTVTDNDLDEILDVLHDINDDALTPYANCTDSALLAASEEYTLDSEALSHLDDVYYVVHAATIAIVVVALLAAAALAHVGVRCGRRRLGAVLTVAGACALTLFAAAGVWALVDFYGLFQVFHTLFFAQGSWTFSNESLLITMYPLAFWMGMGATWLVVSVALSILSIAIGRKLLARS